MDKIKLYESATKFLDYLFGEIKKHNIDVENLFLDHLCYRVESINRYEELKEIFSKNFVFIGENLINGRPISAFKLKEPISYKERLVSIIELPSPKLSNTHSEGFEHAEFVTSLDLKELVSKYSHLNLKTKGLDKKFNQELEIEFSIRAVKFHNLSLEDVIAAEQNFIPPSFVDIQKLNSKIKFSADYFGTSNFVGRKVNGHEVSLCIMTKDCAEKILLVQRELEKLNLTLNIFDSYRPQRAVDDFKNWVLNTTGLQYNEKYHPKIKRSDLFETGFLARFSNHSSGSTVDLTIDGLEMGTIFDFFDESSATFYEGFEAKIKNNRKLLHDLMIKNGFRNYSKEWWHYTLNDQPFNKIYFDFPIEKFWPY